MAQQENVQQEVKITINDLIYTQIKDLGKLMDRLENRMDKLADKIDGLCCDMNTSTNHGQIANISTIGIAMAVIYPLLR